MPRTSNWLLEKERERCNRDNSPRVMEDVSHRERGNMPLRNQSRRCQTVAAALLLLTAVLTPPAEAGSPETFFAQPLDHQANQVLRAAGCVMPEHSGSDGKGENHSCSTLDRSGIPGTTNLAVYGPQPRTDFGSFVSPPEDQHVYMEWVDSPPGGVLPAHAQRQEAERMLREVLDAEGARKPDRIVAAFFAPVRRDGHSEVTMEADGLKFVVRIYDNLGMGSRALFVAEHGGRLPTPVWLNGTAK